MSSDAARDLLDDYAERARKRGRGAEAMALRTESVDMRSILSHVASGGTLEMDEIKKGMIEGQPLNLEPSWAASLGRVLSLQNVFEDDLQAGKELLRKYAAVAGRDAKKFQRLYVELLIEEGSYDAAREYLNEHPDLRRIYHDYLYAETYNPFTPTPFKDLPGWLARFNAPFRGAGLEQIDLSDDEGKPFDRLMCESRHTVDGPLVSVILTSFRPERDALLTAVRSVLSQTWVNLQLIIVDDASPPEFAPLLSETAQLDARIILKRLPINGGTYNARNVGWSIADGEFITGQDADDWSHPERIERQMQPLLKDPALPGSRARAIAVTENLVRVRPDYLPLGTHAPSLLIRRAWATRLGGYLPARKAADNELQHRLDAIADKPVADVNQPLSIYRVLPSSLSRADFRPGWSHPARRAFWGAYHRWHAKSSARDLRYSPGVTPPVAVPRRFQVTPEPNPQLDVVLAGDWRQDGGPQRSMLEEIRALRRARLKVGILHMEAARFMTAGPGRLIPAIQDLVNSGEVTQLFLDDDIRVRLLILRYPPILQFIPLKRASLRTERLVILANQAPSERDGTDRRYVVGDCTRNAERLFGVEPLWIPQGPVVRQALLLDAPGTPLAGFDIPAIVDLEEWSIARKRSRREVPVIGRHSRDNRMKWPEDPKVLELLYPQLDDIDVRIMGGARTPLGTLGLDAAPSNWLVFDTSEIPVRHFLSSIDYFVYFQHSQAYDAFGRAVLEAIAAGCIAILSSEFQATFGDAAIYVEPPEVGSVVRRLHASPELREVHARKAYDRVRSQFSYESYVDLVVERLLSTSWSMKRSLEV